MTITDTTARAMGQKGSTECPCSFAGMSFHDPLLELECNAGAVGRLRAWLVEGSPSSSWGSDLAEWGEIADFIDEHSWSDQAAMHDLADLVRWLDRLEQTFDRLGPLAIEVSRRIEAGIAA